MLQSMAFGGYLGDSLFSNVGLRGGLWLFVISKLQLRSSQHRHTYRNSSITGILFLRNLTTPSHRPSAALVRLPFLKVTSAHQSSSA